MRNDNLPGCCNKPTCDVSMTPPFLERARCFNCGHFCTECQRIVACSPLVSVIIPAYNSEKHLRQCIESVVNQDFSDIEVIIVCAPSSDNTLSIAKEFRDKDPRVRIIEESKKTSCAHARNIGFEFAKGYYILLLDSDDYFEPGKISTQVEFMDDNPVLMWSMHPLKVITGDTTKVWENPIKVKSGGELFGGLHTIMFKRFVFENIQHNWGYMFNEKMKHTDDADFVSRINTFPYGKLTEPLVVFRRNPDGLSAHVDGFEADMTVIGIAIRNHRYGLLRDYLDWKTTKNFLVNIAIHVTGIDWVEVKRKLLS